ncbi:unnamed protein product, partial [Amoebophrya sp. A25]
DEGQEYHGSRRGPKGGSMSPDRLLENASPPKIVDPDDPWLFRRRVRQEEITTRCATSLCTVQRPRSATPFCRESNYVDGKEFRKAVVFPATRREGAREEGYPLGLFSSLPDNIVSPTAADTRREAASSPREDQKDPPSFYDRLRNVGKVAFLS